MSTSTNNSLIGLVKLMRMAYSGQNLTTLGNMLIERAHNESGGNALMDLSMLLQLRGERQLALSIQKQAIEAQQLYSPPSFGNDPDQLRLLVIMTEGDLMANTPVEFLLEYANVKPELIYLSQDRPWPVSLPEHDVLFVAIAQSDQNQPILKQLCNDLDSWAKPVLNKPDRIDLLSRDGVANMLSLIPRLIMPKTERVSRLALEQVIDGEIELTETIAEIEFPIIIRPVDSHAGNDLSRMASLSELANYLSHVKHAEFYVSHFVDYSSKDGLFRKYRIVLINGKPFICHLAISSHWMVHYLNAGMSDSAEKRAEEESVMKNFDQQFAFRHAEALCEINQRVGLDYFGIDCAETVNGELLVFEVDSCMIVHAIDPVDIFPYKQQQMAKLFTAFEKMLFDAQDNKNRVKKT